MKLLCNFGLFLDDEMKFPYVEKESRIFGKILAPLVYIEILSKDGLWYGLENVLVDDITSGRRASIKGITPFELTAYIRTLTIKVTNREFETSIAIADDEVPVVLGRHEALDLFNAEFVKGKELVLE